MGTQQSGVLNLQIADLVKDARHFTISSTSSNEIIEKKMPL
jgi:RecG-like helicase